MTDLSDIAAATAAIREAIDAHTSPLLAGIPGVGKPFADILVTRNMARLGFGFLGWSPTLHGVEIAITREFATVDDQGRPRPIDEIAAAFATEIAPIAERQRHRAEHGARLGTARPFKPTVLSHVHVDAAFADLRGATTDTCRNVVLESCRRAHGEKHRGGQAHRASGVLLGESRTADGEWLRCILPHVKLRSADGTKRATMRGFDVEIPCDDLPETVLLGLPGRRFGDLAELHPALDDRIIRRVTGRPGKTGIIVTIDIRAEPIDEILPPTIVPPTPRRGRPR